MKVLVTGTAGIEEQTNNKMLAQASPEYSFFPVCASMVLEEKSQPKSALIWISLTLAVGLSAILFVQIYHYNFENGPYCYDFYYPRLGAADCR